MAMVMTPIAMTMVVVVMSDGDYDLPIRCGYRGEWHQKYASEES